MVQTENMTHANCASVVIANINKPSENGVNAKRTSSFWQNVFQKRLLCLGGPVAKLYSEGSN